MAALPNQKKAGSLGTGVTRGLEAPEVGSRIRTLTDSLF